MPHLYIDVGTIDGPPPVHPCLAGIGYQLGQLSPDPLGVEPDGLLVIATLRTCGDRLFFLGRSGRRVLLHTTSLLSTQFAGRMRLSSRLPTQAPIAAVTMTAIHVCGSAILR